MSPLPSIANILGPACIGIIVSSIIFGINCLQLYFYYTKYANGDGATLKIYVSALMVVDTLHVLLLVISYYHYTVTYFGDIFALAYGYWTLLAEVAVGGLLVTMVQLYFAFRVYTLSGKCTLLPVVISILSICGLALSIVFTVVGLEIHLFASGERLKPYSAAGLSAELACDVLIAGTLIYYLHAKRTVFPRTNRAINLLIMYALNTCLLTTIFTIIDLTLFLLFPETMIYTVFFFVLIRLYTCSMLSTLNSRENVRHALGTHDTVNILPARIKFGRCCPEADSELLVSADTAATKCTHTAQTDSNPSCV